MDVTAKRSSRRARTETARRFASHIVPNHRASAIATNLAFQEGVLEMPGVDRFSADETKRTDVRRITEVVFKGATEHEVSNVRQRFAAAYARRNQGATFSIIGSPGNCTGQSAIRNIPTLTLGEVVRSLFFKITRSS